MNPRYVRTEERQFIKDKQTGALLNTDTAALNSYKQRRKEIQERQADRQRIETLENKVDEILELLKSALTKG